MRVKKTHVTKGLHHARRATRRAGLATARVTVVVSKHAHKTAKRGYKKAHHHLAKRPHERLMARGGRYARWHSWRHHHKVHYATLAVYLMLVGALLVANYQRAFAVSDLTQSWDFATPANYTFDDDAVETSGTSARLKAQNYASDGQTAALYHMDESSGGVVNDSSSNANAGDQTNASFGSGQLNNALDFDGSSSQVSVPDSSSLSLSQQNTLEAWTKLDSGISAGSNARRQGIIDKGEYQLYYDNETGKITYELANNAATDWERVAGNDINGSWDLDGNLTIESSQYVGSNLYIGLGNGTGDAEVWRWNGSSWTQIGGDGLNDCWPTNTYESVTDMSTDGTNLYVGLGSGTGDAEVWMWNGSTWTKIGGDGINSGWQVSTFEYVYSLTYMGGNLYAGLGSTANDAEVWRWNGSTWTKIGGDSLNSGWTTNFEAVYSLKNDGTNVYAGLGATTWYGDSHTGSGDSSDLLANDGSYMTVDPPDYDNIEEGVNTVYFRTWDAAGNVTTSYVTAALKVNTNGAPSAPENLDVSPETSTTNSFAFSWDLPVTFVGDANNLDYCYTVNIVPSESTCSYTSTRSLSSGAYATQPGENTLYVVARDESSNINYDNYATVSFTANTPSPGLATNVDIVDVSIKSTSNWRLALTWEPPTYTGAGISSYRIYRSVDNATFSFVGSSTSTTYIDAGLSQQTYYYYVRACDSTNNCSANSATVSMLPTGKFTEPATMTSEPEVDDITTKRASVSWTTDRASDSKVAIGTDSGEYSPSEVGSSDQVTSHQIDLDNLAAGTTYYYVVKWTDEDGNTGVSQEYSFTTDPAPVIKEVETTKIGLSTAIISFTTKGATKISLLYGESEAFGGLETINTSLAESRYSIEVTGLTDGSKYFYMLTAFDSEGNDYDGNIFSFSTPPRPRIANLRFQSVEGEPTSTQEITWTTNVPSTSTITYGIVGANGTDVQDSKLKTNHKMIIRGLQDDSRYFIIAQSRDADGNLAVSDRQEFRTALDTRPPKVFDISIEPSIRGTGAEARGQIIVSWKTDEPSSSQVGYAEGSDASVFNSRTTEDTELTTEHIVVVSDLPTSRVYSIQPISRDKSGNAGLGEPESAIIGRATESVLTIIFNTLQRVFGL